eukprot:TRINITY_DN3202_c0_g1_i1.p1 TRINITY_DN3202_c0_g1~~TRINITY_DN3202_c0_g1_i1.p1  ORF type:complete len:400 (+),score=85.59 TRINITY_DN3202_c0_g1_i1:38-1237(+)
MSAELNSEFREKAIRERLPHNIDESTMKEIGGVFFDFLFDCAYSPDDKFLVFGSTRGDVHVIDVETECLNRTLKDHTRNVDGVAFSPNGQLLATSSDDKSIIIYNLPDFSILRRLNNVSGVYGIVFSDCSNYLYSGDISGTLKKWNINNGSIVLEEKIHSHYIWRVKLVLDGKHLLTASADRTAQLINSDDFSVVRKFPHNAAVTAIASNPTKRMIAIGDQFNQVKLWNMDDGSCIITYDMDGEVFSLHFFSPILLFIMSGDGCITSYNVDTFQRIQKVYCGCDYDLFSCAISSNMSHLACGRCTNRTIKIYSIVPNCDTSYTQQLIELSKDGGHVLSTLMSINTDAQIIRHLVASGVHMSKKDYDLIINKFWDLIDINRANGGNMHIFTDDLTDEDND